jgi:hypothetical protein
LTGFDPKLWKQLAETGALGMRVPEAAEAAARSLLDASPGRGGAGKRLVTGPLLETIAAARAVWECGGGAEGWLRRSAGRIRRRHAVVGRSNAALRPALAR